MTEDPIPSADDGPRGTPLPHDIQYKDTKVHIPRRDETDPEIAPGAAIDIDAGDMPDDGVLEIFDADEDILESERSHDLNGGIG
jgi:hypothetical protein